MPNVRLHNEKMLLLQTANGDEQAFARLFEHYRPNIYTTALRVTGDSARAEEILQDTFLKVWLKRTTLPQIDNFGAWLYTIAQNLTYNVLRQQQREKAKLKSIYKHQDPGLSINSERLLEENEYLSLLNSAVHQLPAKQKQTFILIKQQGFKRDEVASILKVSSETVKWNLEQAIRNIRAFCLAKMERMVFFLVFPFLF